MSSISPNSHETTTVIMTGLKPSGFLTRIKRMFTRLPIRDTSYLTAVFFVLGAAFFAINGFFYIFMTKQPQLTFHNESEVGLPVTSCLGDFFFFLGCSAAILEALNTGRGGPMPDVEEDNSASGAEEIQEMGKHEGPNPWPIKSAVPREKTEKDIENGITTPDVTSTLALIGSPNFIWYPSMKQLRGYYIRDVAFIASVVSWIGIVFFTIATIAGIPGVANLTVINVYYYLSLLPTFLGGFFFLVAALMQTTLTQRKWYIPAPTKLSWYVGIFNSIGSIGFALGGCLWYAGESAYWAATLATFWGAWGWFIGSSIAWYIIMDNYP